LVYGEHHVTELAAIPTLTKKRFLKVNIEISNICNLQCTFCPEVIRSKKMMDLDLFEKIIPQVGPLTEQVTFHLMGEPLVHPKLEAMIEICGKHKVPIFLVSNGVLLNEKRAELLLNPAFRQVCFSLHSYPDNYPDRDPSEYLRKIFEFTQRALEVRPDLYINYRLWNLKEANEHNQNNDHYFAEIEKYFNLNFRRNIDVRVQKSVRILNRLYLHFDTRFDWPGIDLPIIGTKGTCKGLSNHFGILVDGTVVPCCLDKEGKIPLGNAKETSIVDILQSEKAAKIFKGFRERKLLEPLCQRCQYITRF
jgi:radical SAM protein with 4Fe4S-binding SPASM domain